MGLTQRLDALRARGWVVAVHNDYKLAGKQHTFWLFTKGDRCAKGEGRTDEEALAHVDLAVAAVEAEASFAIGEAAVRLGDQARVRRALDKFVRRSDVSAVVGSRPRVVIGAADRGDTLEVLRTVKHDLHETELRTRNILVAFLEEVLRG